MRPATQARGVADVRLPFALLGFLVLAAATGRAAVGGDGGTLEGVAVGLESADAEVRSAALAELRRRAWEFLHVRPDSPSPGASLLRGRVVPSLLRLMQTPPLDQQRSAARTLEMFGAFAIECAPAVGGALALEDTLVRNAALAVLETLGPRAADQVPRIEAVLAEDRPGSWGAAAAALGGTGRPGVAALLRQLRGPPARLAAALAGLLKAPLTGGERLEVAAFLAHEQGEVRARAAECLALGRLEGELGPAEALALAARLSRALEQHPDDVGMRGSEAVGRLGAYGRGALPALQSLVRRAGPSHVREAALSAIVSVGPTAATVPDLIPALSDASSSVRAAAARALSRLGPAAGMAAVDALRAASKREDNPEVAVLLDEALERVCGK